MFHETWLHFRRAKVGVGVWCSCVQNTSKEALHRVLAIGTRDKKNCFSQSGRSCIAACSLRICRPEVEQLLDIRRSSTLIFVKLHRLITMFLGCSETNSLSAIIPQLKKTHRPKYSNCNFRIHFTAYLTSFVKL